MDNGAIQRVALDGVTLTNAYTGNTSDAINARSIGSVTLLLNYTTGAGETDNKAQVQIEYSDRAQKNWHTVNKLIELSGALAATNYLSAPREIGINATYIRIKAKEDGVAANYGTLTVTLILSPRTSSHTKTELIDDEGTGIFTDWAYTYTYTGDNLTSVVRTDGVTSQTKTFTYTGDNLTSESEWV